MAELKVTFRTPSNGEISKTFSERPMGMEFVQKMPMILTSVRGEAAKLGVRRGWEIQAVGGVSLSKQDFPDAFRTLKEAALVLHEAYIVRDCPKDHAAVADLSSKLGTLPPAEVPAYLRRFSYAASSAEVWADETQPVITLGVIDGHKEKGEPTTHTWYALQCCLKFPGEKTWRWQVERRLAHMRALLHAPVRSALGKAYDEHFQGAHFARHGGPPGTTARLEAWLAAYAGAINSSKVSPVLVAATLRFLEAPEDPSAVAAAETAGPTLPAAGEAPSPDMPAGSMEAGGGFPDDRTDDGEEGGEPEEQNNGTAASADGSPTRNEDIMSL